MDDQEIPFMANRYALVASEIIDGHARTVIAARCGILATAKHVQKLIAVPALGWDSVQVLDLERGEFVA